ncbi:hypothetical protein PIB30_056181 [Stylosanthes scabra]|uniref:Ubiquitin-like protease family profile domain-containing protein n=1 Tax=Stylosanthes scabra TaxID=79078 RepID=A0ABU6TJ39_9FABA|nr:hypothetical protein [Stylosanthes scabra]
MDSLHVRQRCRAPQFSVTHLISYLVTSPATVCSAMLAFIVTVSLRPRLVRSSSLSRWTRQFHCCVAELGRVWFLLLLIYCPMEDPFGHWFLMVIPMRENALFRLDTFPERSILPDREKLMGDTAAMISAITNRDWPIVDCKGILNCTSSDVSGAWVIQWLNMEDQFEVTVDGVRN